MSGSSFNVVSTGVYHVGTIFDISKTHNLFLLLTPQNQRVRAIKLQKLLTVIVPFYYIQPIWKPLNFMRMRNPKNENTVRYKILLIYSKFLIPFHRINRNYLKIIN